MSLDETQKKLNEYFTQKLETFGATAKGVDYNGEQAQQTRFAELVKVINPAKKFSVIDYGSGYGAMFEFLLQRGWDFEYYGVDLIEKMVLAGREKYRDFPNARFTTDERELPVADYLVAAGVFNIKLDAPYDEWRNFVCETLPRMNALCSKGFSFNMLTKYSDAERMAERPDLFYGDPLFFFDFCKRNFSRNVALLHDYGLYDFTILVRKDV
ncbi:MAG: class I SAM-dependent methyltransferase [Chloroflexi bacterium]|nr:class I SAM-dependent methyltransferase [Chloroflexota bacterium]MCA2001919.1 class I SAM-dependent methyltransferase [Chloroflexota bacterium]